MPILAVDEVTSRAKRAIRTWAALGVTAPLLLDDRLSKFRAEDGLLSRRDDVHE